MTAALSINHEATKLWPKRAASFATSQTWVRLLLIVGLSGLATTDAQEGAVGRAVEYNTAPVITTVQGVLSLTGKEAAERKAVRLMGRLIYANPPDGEVLLKDPTGVIKIKVDLSKYPAEAGMEATVLGKTAAPMIRFPDHPSGQQYLTTFEEPTTVGDRYLTKVSGYIYPPRTGEYTFWIASDNGGELKLSTDESPANAKMIGEVHDIFSYTASHEWDKMPSQRSAKIVLQADHRYYLEALHWEEEGEDLLAVAWEGPGISRSIIGGEFLSPSHVIREDEPRDKRGSILREFWLGYPFPTAVESEVLRYTGATMESILKTPPALFGTATIAEAHLSMASGQTLPEATPASLEQIWPEEKDFNFVEVEGVVSQISDDGVYWTLLELSDHDRRMIIRLPNPDRKTFQHLLHARIIARGFCEGAASGAGERLASILWLPTLREISLKEPLKDDWSLLPAIPIHELGPVASEFRRGQRIKVSGQVLEVKSGQIAVIRDPISQFTAFSSADGETWTEIGDPIDIAMNHSVYAGLAALGAASLSTATFDYISLPLAGKGIEIGAPMLAGSEDLQNGRIVITGTGNIGSVGGGNARRDDFHFLYSDFSGDGEIIGKIISLVPEVSHFPGVEAGIMIRDTVEPDSAFSFAAMSTVGDSHFEIRRGKGSLVESFADGKISPYWLKLVRRSAPPLTVHFLKDVSLPPHQGIEVMGVLEPADAGWNLNEAFFQIAESPNAKLLMRPGLEILSVQQMRQLSAAELGQRRTAKIRGVVTAKISDLFLQDGTGGVRISPSAWQKFSTLEIGQYIEVVGECEPGLYSPTIAPEQKNDIKILGKGRMPKPLPATWNQLVRGGYDAQWVEVIGVVRRVEGRVVKIQMAGGDLSIDFGFEMKEENARNLIDATVQIQGVCSVIANEKKQFTGVRLIVPAAEYIVVEAAPPSDPFAAPLQSISSLLRFGGQNEIVHRVKVEGVVTYARDGLNYIQDSGAGIEVNPISSLPLKSGDRVEVLGFPDSSGSSFILSDALIHPTGTAFLPRPVVVENGQSPQAAHLAKRITVSAEYLGRSTLLGNDVFQFQRGGRIFQALLSSREGAFLELEAGSTVSLTGVYQAASDRVGKSSPSELSFEMLLASAADVVVLRKAAWWNLKRGLWIGTVFLVILATAATWIATISRKNLLLRSAKSELQIANDELEKRVGHRTADLASANAELSREQALLRALLDSSPDEIYFKDTQSRYLKASRAQADNFGVASPDDLIGKSDIDFFGPDHAGPSYRDEQEIVRQGRPMIGQIRKEIRKNGELHWMLSSKMPLRNEANIIVGTFGISKDITAIKDTEGKLEEANKLLVDTSHRAGMAEVATNVLHNVGNVLNSVNVSAALVADRVRQSRIGNVARAGALLQAQGAELASFLANDPRGQKFPNYLITLAESLTADQQVVMRELESLGKNVGHIKEIVAMQQNYAKVSGVTETIAMAELVEDALRINAGFFKGDSVTLVREYIAQPHLTVEKNKVIQILVNLLKNAKDACDESDRPDKVITAQIRTEADRVKVTITDNGVGIHADNLTRIFSHGFTTRKDGHGFGLHSGALAAMEMGGALHAYSRGPGSGASFILDLPLQGKIKTMAGSLTDPRMSVATVA